MALRTIATKALETDVGRKTAAGVEYTGAGIAVAAAVALAPAAAVAAGVAGVAWARGWDARRMRGPVAGIGGGYLAAQMIWDQHPAAPVLNWWDGMGAALDAQVAVALVETSGMWVPVGMVAGWAWWARYRDRMRTGRARSIRWQERHDMRLWKRRMATARKEAARELTPLISLAQHRPPASKPQKGDREIVLGPLAEMSEEVPASALDESTARHPRYVAVPTRAIDQHIVVVGDSGSGKTTLLRRLALGAAEATWTRHHQGATGRPLVIQLDCKGGKEAPEAGAAFAHDMVSMGIDPRRVGVWPFDTRLDMWGMAPRDIQATLLAMVKSTHEHYDELRESLLHLVLDAPGARPIRSSLQLLSRFDEGWLRSAWALYPTEMAMVDAVTSGKDPAVGDAVLKYGNLFRNLGRSLDAGRDLNDFDALYMAVAGTRRPKEARAQAAALIQLVTDLLHRSDRKVIVFIDEYSAVSGDGGVGLIEVVERWRSLGGSVVVAAQSWEGLGDSDDERSRLVATCSGGRILMRTTDGEDLVERSGTVRRPEPSQHLTNGKFGGEGAIRMQHTHVVPPQRLRAFQPGDVCYARSGAAEFGVTALVPPLRLPRPELAAHLRRTAIEGPSVPLAELEAGLSAAVAGMSNEPGMWEA